ncbi:major facilitator superfamily domain-containing protein [Rhodocollybia butyracea]|uniref:Major facilitator superfamily domain-containing protein n=1 Tax=Rhodocollybia butyracea TaxID=206335 RepID=A0A9P5UGB2_9AGAR|nr:major facilitator superfamily domain-containing protein [Rhodocollybia butyracea]
MTGKRTIWPKIRYNRTGISRKFRPKIRYSGQATQTPLPPSNSTIRLSNPNSTGSLASPEHVHSSSTDIVPTARNQSSLPPIDKGFGAWSFVRLPTALSLIQWPISVHQLTAAFFVEAIIIQLFALQSVLYAIGGSFLYFPCISYLSESFNHKRGFANGVLFAGNTAGGIVLPLTLPPLLFAYGPSKTLRIMSIATALLVVSLPFIKGRLPVSRSHTNIGPTPRGRENREWTKSFTFWVLVVANTLQGFGYFVPIVWLPTFASDLELSHATFSIVLTLLNCGSIVGFSIPASTSAVTFILWGGVLSYNLAGLLSFGIGAYGIFAGGWLSSWTGLTKPLTVSDPSLSTTPFGALLFSRGMGSIFSIPISSPALLSNSTSSSVDVFKNHLGFHVGGGKF